MNPLADVAGPEACYYCKLAHPLVEAGGLWHCPNVLCSGCGAQSWRREHLTSYKENRLGYTVDPAELIEKARAHVDTLLYGERALIDATLDMIPYWEKMVARDSTTPDTARAR